MLTSLRNAGKLSSKIHVGRQLSSLTSFLNPRMPRSIMEGGAGRSGCLLYDPRLFCGPMPAARIPHHATSRVEIKETEKRYELTIDLPGIKKADIGIFIKDNILVLEGQHRLDSTATTTHASPSTFHRTFSIPNDVHQDSVTARLEDGVLYLIMGKVDINHGKKIVEIQ